MRFIRILFRILVGVLAVIGLATLLLAVGVGTIGWRLATGEQREVPSEAVLALDLRHGVVERVPTSFFGELDGQIVLHQAVAAIATAAEDSRITALIARLGGTSMSYAHAQELSAAIRGFNRSGKLSYAFAESFGEGGDPNADYLLASSFSEIWMQPSGEFGAVGILIEQPFLRGLLEKLGVEAQLDQRREYKGGADIFVAVEMSEAQRENLQRLAESLRAQLAGAMAEGRKLGSDAALRLVDTGPHGAEEAQAAGLIDRLSYWSDLTDLLDPKGDRILDIADYIRTLPQPPDDAAELALIVASGPIMGGSSDPLIGEEVAAADDLVTAIRDAAEESDIAAILLRIDSPGGSYVASDTIWREIVRAKEKKPVVVSMAGVAASGGYFIAAPASAILADPGTVTGSIGVYAGKFVLSELWEKLGVKWGRIEGGANAGIWSANQPFTPSQWEKFQTQLDRTYADFLDKVREGRKLDLTKVEAAAGGRIWTGEDALNAGLVDRLGGLAEAVEVAKELAGIAAERKAALVPFPAERDFFELWTEELLGVRAPALRRSIATVLRTLDAVAPVAERLAPLLEGGDQRLMAPPTTIR
ncbi:MAG TPA: signal peptide peptidase SppA [Alphaproteobacteria bacterium]|nr:signal peptide peptidase SppA [Alphaproteobacteria bacterium]